MREADFYYSIEEPGEAEFKDRGSKFIACVFPLKAVEAFKPLLEATKKKYPKATHYCFAYRIGLDGNTYRVSDDGEPSGSAGKPIFASIESKQLTDVLIIVVRYFGGSLLGVPGLINAYRTAAALALQTTPIVQKSVEIPYLLHFDYTIMNDVMMVVKQYNCSVVKQDLQLFCDMVIGIPKNRLSDVTFRLADIRGLESKAFHNSGR